MQELVRSTDWVLVSRLAALLRGEGLTVFHLDFHASAVEGSIGALPQRLAVPEAEADAARRLIRDAGFGHVLMDAPE
ncbi:MAG TPA: DUF2007 domain-containing protein [Sphingomonadales bacterium]